MLGLGRPVGASPKLEVPTGPMVGVIPAMLGDSALGVPLWECCMLCFMEACRTGDQGA